MYTRISLFSFFTLFYVCSLFAVEHSIIPTIEKFEIVENLPSQKYSKRQYAEIREALLSKGNRIRLVTYNMLMNYLENKTTNDEDRWVSRFPRVVELIQEMQPDILAVQEVAKSQRDDLLSVLGDTFSFYSKPHSEGELSGIFYKKERFELIDNHVWYMMEKPKPIHTATTLTMVQLKDKKTGQCIAVFNTHLSFCNIEKRDFQVHFIAETIKPIAETMPLIVCGDLNTFPARLDLKQLPFYDGDYIHRILTKNTLKDAKEMSLLGHLGPLSTFTNLPDSCDPFKGTGTPGVFLDHVYVTKEITVLMHAVQPGTVHGHFPSDHMPIVVDFIAQEV